MKNPGAYLLVQPWGNGINSVEINFEGIVVIVGNYGSGKTEVSVNLAIQRKAAGINVRIADLDLVNPYFRTREAKKQLLETGIEVVLPAEQYLQADLPILTPEVSGIIRNPGPLTILDVGGDDVGATVLASLADSFQSQNVNQNAKMLQVVNPYRPFTETIEGCIKIKNEIEKASRMKVTGLVGNANLIDETSVTHIYDGFDFVKSLSLKTGLPLEFITIADHLSADIDLDRFDCPVLILKRQLVPPWKKAVSIGI